jgi:hypothetical protein
MATIATFAGGTYNPSYVSSGISNGILVETWNRFTIERDNSNTSGSITWRDISGSDPWKFNFTQSTSVPSIAHGNGHVEDITSKDGWYIHFWTSTNSYLGYTIISIITSSSGGGTSTEGVATVGDAVGSLVDYPSFSEINANITAESPGGSNYSYTVLKDNVQIAQMNTHSNGTATSFDVDYSTVGRFGVWDFTVMEVSTVTVRHLARLTIVDPNARKNVFRNFW